VLDVEGDPVDFEIIPVFTERSKLASNIFQVAFVAEMVPFEVKNFIIKHDTGAK